MEFSRSGLSDNPWATSRTMIAIIIGRVGVIREKANRQQKTAASSSFFFAVGSAKKKKKQRDRHGGTTLINLIATWSNIGIYYIVEVWQYVSLHKVANIR